MRNITIGHCLGLDHETSVFGVLPHLYLPYKYQPCMYMGTRRTQWWLQSIGMDFNALDFFHFGDDFESHLVHKNILTQTLAIDFEQHCADQTRLFKMPAPGPRFNIKIVFSDIGIPLWKQGVHNRFILIMGIYTRKISLYCDGPLELWEKSYPCLSVRNWGPSQYKDVLPV